MDNDPDIFKKLAEARSPETWAAMVAGMLYVYRKSAQASRVARTLECGMCGLLGYAVGPSASAWAGIHEALGMVLVTSLGYLLLDALSAIAADRATIQDILVRLFGGNKNGKG